MDISTFHFRPQQVLLQNISSSVPLLNFFEIGSVNVDFNQKPSDPSYFKNGSDANLVWDYTDPDNKIQSILYGVEWNGEFVQLMANDSNGVLVNPNIPPPYKGRVKIEGRATLVIKNINPEDNTKFNCELFGSFVNTIQSTVQLIVAGMYYTLQLHAHLSVHPKFWGYQVFIYSGYCSCHC